MNEEAERLWFVVQELRNLGLECRINRTRDGTAVIFIPLQSLNYGVKFEDIPEGL
jgi:hypothetical protein